MDLFDYMRQEQQQTESPLAARIRPVSLDEVVGQEHIIGKGRLLRRAIQADKLGSLIFYGPPGTGKTTLARVIANTTSAEFVQLNATTSGKKDMEEAVKAAKDRLGMYGRKTILFIDEIHRFNKSQQDYLLPFVEDGTVTLIGATTENPYFEVNGALISRSTVFELKPLSQEDIRRLILRAVYDNEKGMGMYNAAIDDDAADFLADVADGDARRALSAVELGVLTTEPSGDGKIHITLGNLSCTDAYEVSSTLMGSQIKSVKATVVGGKMDDHNTFDEPDVVSEKAFDNISFEGDRISFTIPASSVMHIEAEI